MLLGLLGRSSLFPDAVVCYTEWGDEGGWIPFCCFSVGSDDIVNLLYLDVNTWVNYTCERTLQGEISYQKTWRQRGIYMARGKDISMYSALQILQSCIASK